MTNCSEQTPGHSGSARARGRLDQLEEELDEIATRTDKLMTTTFGAESR